MSWQAAQSAILDDGRLHLQHGPIDLIIEVAGCDPALAYDAAEHRFETLLAGLAAELPRLRQPSGAVPKDPVAQRMVAAVRPFFLEFITPMAAVAGAVADEIRDAVLKAVQPAKLIVNNGGDIALHLQTDQTAKIAAPGAMLKISGSEAVRGIASSGWRGRSHSLGIADQVTVLASNAALADAAATMIANRVDLPDHPGIRREPASELAPESDLGKRLVTVFVPELASSDVCRTLEAGADYARSLLDRGVILGAYLHLQGEGWTVVPGPQ